MAKLCLALILFLSPIGAILGRTVDSTPSLPIPTGGSGTGRRALDDDSAARKTKLYVAGDGKRWRSNEVVYEVDGESIPAGCRGVIAEAMADIAEDSCITFRRRTSQKGGYVRIYRSPGDEGCYATLGFVSNSFVHVLHLGPDCCFKEVVIHELLHNLGAHHEQTRPDRDNYVTVNWEKITKPFRSQFYKISYKGDPPKPACSSSTPVSQLDSCVGPLKFVDSGYSYDLNSIMHYFSTIFSTDGSETLVAVDPSVGSDFGSSSEMTILDRYKLNDAYNCRILPAKCGGLLDATSGTLESQVDDECRWDIVAPMRSVILVTFHTVRAADCVEVTEPRVGRSVSYCSGTVPTVYVTSEYELTVKLTRPSGAHFHATYAVLSPSDACCRTLTLTEGGATTFSSQFYTSAYLGTYVKNGDVTKDNGRDFPVYAKDDIGNLFLSHDAVRARFSTSWIVTSQPGSGSGNAAFGTSTLSCPEHHTIAIFADFSLPNPAFVDFVDGQLSCVTTCSGSDIPAAPSGFTLDLDGSSPDATYNHGYTVPYVCDADPDLVTYAACLAFSAAWSQPLAPSGCAAHSATAPNIAVPTITAGAAEPLELTDDAPCAFVATPDYDAGTGYPNKRATRDYRFYSQEATEFVVRYVEEFEIHFTKKCKKDSVSIFSGKSKANKYKLVKTSKICGTQDASTLNDFEIKNVHNTVNKVTFKTDNKNNARGFKALICIVEYVEQYYNLFYP